MNFCQAPNCEQVVTHQAVEPDDNTILLCTQHAEYVESGNQEVRRSRQVRVEPLGGDR